MGNQVYICNQKIEINKKVLEKYGNKIYILADNDKKLYQGELQAYHPDNISNEILSKVMKIELFVEIKNRFYFVDKTFVLNTEIEAENKVEEKEKKISFLLQEFNRKIGDYVA